MIKIIKERCFQKTSYIIPKKWKHKDYNQYYFSWKEKIQYFLQGVFLLLLISKLFYDTYFGVMFLSPVLLLYFKIVKKALIHKQKKMLSAQFKEMIVELNTSLQAGYSLENAIRETYKDMLCIYGRQTLISNELYVMTKKLDNNFLLEEIFQDLGKRSGIDEIKEFSEIITIAKKSGGNMTEILQNCISSITDKIEIKREIDTIMSGKKMESNIMNVVPLFIIVYISISSPGFFSVLYHNFIGIIIMTSCLLVYCFAFYLSQKIVNREYL